MIFPFLNNTNAAVTPPLNINTFEYQVDWENKRLTGRTVTGKEALKIWIDKTLRTQRYIYVIYSWDYGEDYNELIGSTLGTGFVRNEMERRIKEALLVNEKITNAFDFTFNINNSTIEVEFTVSTVYGEVTINI